MNIGTYLQNKLADKMIGGVNFTPGATLWIRLFSTTLNAAGTGTELSNPSYAPLEVDNNTTNFPVAASGAKTNAVRFDFAAAAEDWADIVSIGLFDAETAGNLYFYANYVDPIPVPMGDTFYIDIDDFAFTLT